MIARGSKEYGIITLRLNDSVSLYMRTTSSDTNDPQNWQNIRSYNGQINPLSLKIGDTIRIPVKDITNFHQMPKTFVDSELRRYSLNPKKSNNRNLKVDSAKEELIEKKQKQEESQNNFENKLF